MAVFPRLIFKLIEFVLYKLLANSCYKAAKKVKQYGFLFKNPSPKTPPHQQFSLFYPNVSKCNLKNRSLQTLVSDFNGVLLTSSKTSSFFPYFMLVAFEGGSLFRALILLISYPILCLLDWESKLKAMTFISFCGLPIKNMSNVGSTVLPKFYLENLNLHVFEAFQAFGFKVVFTSVPKVMVEGFLRNYLKVDDVVGTELQTFKGKYFTGLVSSNGLLVKHKALVQYFGEERKPDVGIGAPNLHDHLFISLCKEAYVVYKEKEEKKNSATVPREKYPKPLIFHDGRLAFLPTPFAALCTFLWLPIGIPLAIFRICTGIFLPYKLAILLTSWTGLRITLDNRYNNDPTHPGKLKTGVLFVCTHRTLLDPVFLSTSMGKPLTAVTYSLSKFSEIIAPIKTVRLRRDRGRDGEAMQRLLGEGDLVVCPEGTTCREPYLLRFSPLFAELTDEIVPVAINAEVSMFYGTTASGWKWLDPILFLMNPRPSYDIVVLPKLPTEWTCGGGGKSSYEVANYIQRTLADVLGFQPTNLTRKDKYLMLAGNEGLVLHQHKTSLNLN